MKELIKFIVSALVSKPEKVVLEEIKDNQKGFTQFNLAVDSQDLGRVIGKRGKIIKALRDILRVWAFNKGERVILTLKED